MSKIRLVGSVTKTAKAPAVPAGTIAAFATTFPAGELSVETVGCDWPDGHAVKKPNGPTGTTVAFSEKACADCGMPLQGPPGIVKLRVELAPSVGGPNPPPKPGPPRVSTTRQGVTV